MESAVTVLMILNMARGAVRGLEFRIHACHAFRRYCITGHDTGEVTSDTENGQATDEWRASVPARWPAIHP